MKKEQVLELLKKAAGDNEIDLEKLNVDSITKEWNDSINGAIKAETERAKEKAEQEVVKRLGYESEDDIKKAIESTKTEKEKENDRISKLTNELETLKTTLSEKDNELKETSQKELLKKAGIRDDRIKQAYNLVKGEVTDENDFDTAVKSFIESTPEWVDGSDKRKVTLDDKHDGGEDKTDEADALEGAW